jgi:hypothetical protein
MIARMQVPAVIEHHARRVRVLGVTVRPDAVLADTGHSCLSMDVRAFAAHCHHDRGGEKLILLEKAGAPEPTDLRDLTPEPASRAETANIVARFTRINEMNGDASEAVRVAAFNSFV